ncbi:low temperature requirement protein A [Demequina mangrovi]|uniref:Low temperature requirement protein LtrA n=1 Tax=Demequina mangrovi TaxID=1043493 RepID=A0A1H6U7X0_9MICO|nr:low temperature requirement protein A [Demequina mangrovi]SEI87616.1 Low temperature requirement protein LtrA [Demequina mangrovi]
MSENVTAAPRREVSPVELLFDLAFVLAMIQLTHHLVAHLGWREGAETAVMLVAVYSVWTFTSFHLTLRDVERRSTRAVTILVMGLALVMNGAIGVAFEDGAWLFAVPLVLAGAVPSALSAVREGQTFFRSHSRHMLVWIALSAPLWLGGAAVDPEARLWWWVAAAVIDLIGVFTAHPIPGHVLAPTVVDYDAPHMFERMRLFLLILLGETILGIGGAIADAGPEPMVVAGVVGAFVAVVCLWYSYFGGAEELVVAEAHDTRDPIGAVHRGIVVLLFVMAGLIMLAAGADLVVAEVDAARAGAGGALLLAGPALFLAAQAAYVLGAGMTRWRVRIVGAALLVAGAAVAPSLPPLGAVALLDMILVPVVVGANWRATDAPADPRGEA